MGALLNLAMIGNTFATTAMLQRFLAGIASIVLLTVMAAVLGSLLLSAGFYALFLGLAYYMDPISAAIAGLPRTVIAYCGFGTTRCRRIWTAS